MKRFAVLAAAMLLLTPCTAALPAGYTAFAEDAVNSGTCGENITWSFDSTTFTMTLTGSGEMDDFDSGLMVSVTPWAYLIENIKTVVVQEGITTIGANAFSGCQNLIALSLPESLTTIGEGAFADCTKLEDISVPEGVTEIGGDAFRSTKWLEEKAAQDPLVVVNSILVDGHSAEGEITIPRGVCAIADYAFGNNENITAAVIPDEVTGIGMCAFMMCDNLEAVKIGRGITKLSTGVFFACPVLKDAELSDDITAIDKAAFGRCIALEYITLPYLLESIGELAFSECTAMTEATIPQYVETIEKNAFSGCEKLERITLHCPHCEIDSEPQTLGVPGITTVYGYDGSTAETFAAANGYTFESFGSFEPPADTRGDFDGDGTVGLNDVLEALELFTLAQMGVSELTEEQMLCADVDCNDMLELRDIICILEYYNYNEVLGIGASWEGITG